MFWHRMRAIKRRFDVCVCVRERESERERKMEKERDYDCMNMKRMMMMMMMINEKHPNISSSTYATMEQNGSTFPFPEGSSTFSAFRISKCK